MLRMMWRLRSMRSGLMNWNNTLAWTMCWYRALRSSTHRTRELMRWSVEINKNCPVGEANSCEEQVLSFLRCKSVEILKNGISISHKVRTKTNKPQIVIKCNNRKTENRVLSHAKNLTGTNVFINEHLAHENVGLARLARHDKKRRLIQSTWTRNSKKMLCTIGCDPENYRVFTILEKSDFIKHSIGALVWNVFTVIFFYRNDKGLNS